VVPPPPPIMCTFSNMTQVAAPQTYKVTAATVLRRISTSNGSEEVVFQLGRWAARNNLVLYCGYREESYAWRGWLQHRLPLLAYSYLTSSPLRLPPTKPQNVSLAKAVTQYHYQHWCVQRQNDCAVAHWSTLDGEVQQLDGVVKGVNLWDVYPCRMNTCDARPRTSTHRFKGWVRIGI
jgi:hypothetical protein